MAAAHEAVHAADGLMRRQMYADGCGVSPNLLQCPVQVTASRNGACRVSRTLTCRRMSGRDRHRANVRIAHYP